MCYVKLLFICNHSVCRTRKAHEGNQKRCRCNEVNEWKLTIQCLICEAQSPKGSCLEETTTLEALCKRPDFPVTNESNEMGLIDYSELIKQFGSEEINNTLLEKFNRVTGEEPHRFLQRGIVFSHRELDKILTLHETGKPFFILAGRGPSSPSMHLGHMANFEFAKWLSDVFKQPLLVMLSDDEKHARDWPKPASSEIPPDNEPDIISQFSNCSKAPNANSETYTNYAKENAKDIIAIGGGTDKTFFHVNSSCMSSSMGEHLIKMKKNGLLAWRYLDAYFGFNINHEAAQGMHIASLLFPGIAAAGTLATSYPTVFPPDCDSTQSMPCLIPIALDEDSCLEYARAAAQLSGNPQASILHIKFVSALQGSKWKMTSSAKESVIFASDTREQILGKLNHYASKEASQTSKELQSRRLDAESNICFQYLRFFLEDDKKLCQIQRDYEGGTLSAEKMTEECANTISQICESFTERRSQITEKELKDRMLPLTSEASKHNKLINASFEKVRSFIRRQLKWVSSAMDEGIYVSHGIKYRGLFLAKSQVDFEEPTTQEQYECLICRMLSHESHTFSDTESLFKHISMHKECSINGIALEGPLTFNNSERSVSKDAKFDIELPAISTRVEDVGDTV